MQEVAQLTHEQFTKLGIDARIVAWVHDEIWLKLERAAKMSSVIYLDEWREAGNHFKIQIPRSKSTSEQTGTNH